MSGPRDVILDPRVIEVLHIVVVPTEVSSDSVLFQHRLQVLHEGISRSVFSYRPHYMLGNKKVLKI